MKRHEALLNLAGLISEALWEIKNKISLSLRLFHRVSEEQVHLHFQLAVVLADVTEFVAKSMRKREREKKINKNRAEPTSDGSGSFNFRVTPAMTLKICGKNCNSI